MLLTTLDYTNSTFNDRTTRKEKKILLNLDGKEITIPP